MTEATLPFQNTVLLVSGIPATGKSSFCRYLAREHGFAHYDLECYPRGWPIPQLHQVWERSRGEFVAELYRLHERVAVDWGFPLRSLQWALELENAGARLLWFTGNIQRAREIFVQRGGIDVAKFDAQVNDIQAAGLPKPLRAQAVEAFMQGGRLRYPARVYKEIFPTK